VPAAIDTRSPQCCDPLDGSHDPHHPAAARAGRARAERDALLEYCGLDTLAMVRILEVLEGV
jgi:hypothetical protein